MNRREFLKTSMAAAGVAVVGIDCSGQNFLPGSAYFPQSVASGDPKSDSVVLWTRVFDAARPGSDVNVKLELALDEGFRDFVTLSGDIHLMLDAKAAYHNCVKVRITELSAATTYYYRFVYETTGGDTYVSNTGRTKTAPAADADVPVKFGVLSCQDYNGRYYNT